MCDKINKEFWKCLEKNKYFDISKCAKLQKKELECLFKVQKKKNVLIYICLVFLLKLWFLV